MTVNIKLKLDVRLHYSDRATMYSTNNIFTLNFDIESLEFYHALACE